jgi:O-antigen/teichoic acid export membrane protein
MPAMCLPTGGRHTPVFVPFLGVLTDMTDASIVHTTERVSGQLWGELALNELKGRTVRGGAVTFAAQGIKVALNIGSTLVLARLLTPTDYGLIGMVTGVIGFVETFKDAGLSMATVQRERITHEQISTLFWLNVGLSVALMIVVASLASFLVSFFNEPRLSRITLVLATTFLLSGLTVQHQALLRRNMRFKELTAIDVGSFAAGSIVALGMAYLGFRYWALVGMAIVTSLVNVIAVWVAMPWRPGPPRRNADVKSMIGFGGHIIGLRFAQSFVRNTPNVLLGWYWGAGTVGLYQRAYTLLMFSVDQVQGPVAAVAIVPISRLQSDGPRLRQFFLGAYSVVISCILPIVVTCAIYAEGIVSLMLGRQWLAAAPTFRWLALAGVFVGLGNPQGILLLAMGRSAKSLKLGLADAICVVLSCFAGLQYGAVGIAVGFLFTKLLISIPMMLATFRDTPVTGRDIATTIQPPLTAVALAAAVGCTVKLLLAGFVADWLLTLAGCSLMLLTYVLVLLFAFGQGVFYRDLIAEIIRGKKTPCE